MTSYKCTEFIIFVHFSICLLKGETRERHSRVGRVVPYNNNPETKMKTT